MSIAQEVAQIKTKTIGLTFKIKHFKLKYRHKQKSSCTVGQIAEDYCNYSGWSREGFVVESRWTL